MMNEQLSLWLTYAPSIWFDRKEPFFPDRIGVTVITEPSASPSFNRSFSFDQPQLAKIIEYAIWWDYESGHLYELEHVWVYIGKDGEVLDCEVSFHGKVLKGLRKDRSNLIHPHQVQLYSQPGKHAFSPIAELFELLPNAAAATTSLVGKDGLLVNEMFAHAFQTNAQIDAWVRAYLSNFTFTPSFQFEPYEWHEALFTTWAELREEIPARIHARVAELQQMYGNSQESEVNVHEQPTKKDLDEKG